MRAALIGLVFGIVATMDASAYDAYDPANCNGIGWDDARPLAVAEISASPRVNFVKSPYDDDFKAAACPAIGDTCRKKSYLVSGDLVLVGKTRGEFTCVSYQSPHARTQTWTSGWLPRTALAPVTPMARPALADWTGSWVHPGGGLAITSAGGGRLRIEGDQVVPAGRDLNNGSLAATAQPEGGLIAFVDDGTTPFERPSAGDECRVRLQRVGALLLVEDNAGCGGAGVSFTGLYRRK
uniref:hypothetical protein n=1 Tax=Bradyrhizobium sp. (strain ORS 278) TaxID=114615 RepID=UPI0005A07632|nr:hypothetical protein [Bradyrhizobium sp. ORS 278]